LTAFLFVVGTKTEDSRAALMIYKKFKKEWELYVKEKAKKQPRKKIKKAITGELKPAENAKQ
jgi:hypothetical protein